MIDRQLYNGKVHLIHNPSAKGRSPRYKIMDGDKVVATPKGCTTILGKVIAKDLMGWAVQCAVDYLAEKLPVITKEDLEDASHEYEVKRDFGGSTGTEAHAMVENYLKAKTIPGSGSPEALNAFGAFKRWFESTTPEVINVEEVLYSQEFGYAGTYDCMLKVDGKVYLGDLKTTNASIKAPKGVYAEHFLQLGAYAMAHEEQRLYEEANGGTKLVPIEGLMVISCKKNGKLDVITETDLGLSLADCISMFSRVMNIYLFMEFTTKALGGDNVFKKKGK